MSASIQRAKYTGDPGIFDFLGKVANIGLGIAGGLPIIGGAAQAARQAFFPGDARLGIPGASTFPSLPGGGVIPQFPTGMPGSGAPRVLGVGEAVRCGPGLSRIPGPGANETQCVQLQAKAPGIVPWIQRAIPFGETGMMDVTAMQAGKPCPVSGYHWNKSGYFLKSGEYVPPGTKMVKNRRRNPANPRATSNAITRIKGAKRYAKSLGRITIRDRSSKH